MMDSSLYRPMALAVVLLGGHIPVNLIVAEHWPEWTLVFPGAAIVASICLFVMSVIAKRTQHNDRASNNTGRG